MGHVKLLGFIALVFVAGLVFASHASAQQSQQYQHQSGMSKIPRTPVNGTYTNSTYGLQITLPSGWSGYAMTRPSGVTTVSAIPGGYQSIQGHGRPPISMMITMAPKTTMASPQIISPRMTQTDSCTNSTGSKTVNSVSFTEVTVNCSGPYPLQGKYEVAQTSSAYIIVGYHANSTANYNTDVSAFDSAVGTIQIANSISPPVIPEFPLSAVGMIVAVMVGFVVIIGRTQIMKARL